MAGLSDIGFGFVISAVGAPGASDAELYTEALADAALGASLGYDAGWMIEHHFSDYFPTPSPLVLLSHVAAKHPKLGLGTQVLVTPWYHPLRLASEIAMLSNLTRGTLHLGLGRGTAKYEYDAFGVHMEEARERFREAWEIVRLGISGEQFTYDGAFFKVPRPVRIRPTPASDRINFYGAIGSPPSAEIMADFRLPPLASSNFPQHIQKDILARWTARTEAIGESSDTIRPISIHTFIGDDDDGPRELARQHLAAYCEMQRRHYESDADHWKGIKGYEQFSRYFGNLGRYSDPKQIDPFLDLQLIGSPETIRRKIESYIAIGFNYFIIHTATYGMPRALRHEMSRRFAHSVAPEFSRRFAPSAAA